MSPAKAEAKSKTAKEAAAPTGGAAAAAAATTTTTTKQNAPVVVVVVDTPEGSDSSDGRTSPDEELDLDPSLKAQVDGEVEEFRRRLEAAGQSTKAKLTPIFYLGLEDLNNKFL